MHFNSLCFLVFRSFRLVRLESRQLNQWYHAVWPVLKIRKSLLLNLMHQSIPSANIPRGFAPAFSPGAGICTIWIVQGVARGSVLLSIIISTKMSVDATWRYCSTSNWSIIYTLFFIRNSFVRNLYWDGQIAKKLSVLKPQRLRNFYFFLFFNFSIIILKT